MYLVILNPQRESISNLNRRFIPLQATDSWAGEIDPNLFLLQTATASVG